MRWYVVVEGRQTERKLYQAWLACAFPAVERAPRIEDMADDRYFMIVGNGYPSYLRRIEDAVADIRANPEQFDELMICVDAEDMAAGDRRAEIEAIAREAGCPVTCTVIVHDCCVETWLLGNTKMARAKPHSERLRAFYEFYNVRDSDPEALPAHPDHGPRARFHWAYLCELFKERNPANAPSRAYTKANPGMACEGSYLEALVKRRDDTGHLASFGVLIDRWRALGAAL